MADADLNDAICPDCGKPLPEGESVCECGYVLYDDPEEDTDVQDVPLSPAADPLQDWGNVDSLPQGPWDEMTDDNAEGASSLHGQPEHERSWVKLVLVTLVILLNLAVLGFIVYLIMRPGRSGNTNHDKIIRRIGANSRGTGLVEYASEPDTPARAFEEALAARGINATVKTIDLKPEAILVVFKKEAVWDMAQLRARAERDALAVLQTALDKGDEKQTTISVKLEARMGGDTGTEWETALQLECSRAKAAEVVKLGDARAAVTAAGAKLHKRLLDQE